MRRRTRRFFQWTGIVVLLVVLSIALPIYASKECHYDPETYEKHCTRQNVTLFLFAEAAEITERREKIFTILSTIAIAGFTGTLWWATNKLWRVTRGLWIETARASRRQAREIKQIERPFVFIEGFSYELTVSADTDSEEDIKKLPKPYSDRPEINITRFAVLPRWKNGGRTATVDMKINVWWRGPDGPVPPGYTYRNPAVPFFLGPLDVQHSDVIEIPPAMAIVDWEMKGRRDAEPMIWIWGRADYKDAFGEPHFLEWCYKLRFERHRKGQRMTAGFFQWGEHNRSG